MWSVDHTTKLLPARLFTCLFQYSALIEGASRAVPSGPGPLYVSIHAQNQLAEILVLGHCTVGLCDFGKRIDLFYDWLDYSSRQ